MVGNGAVAALDWGSLAAVGCGNSPPAALADGGNDPAGTRDRRLKILLMDLLRHAGILTFDSKETLVKNSEEEKFARSKR